MSAFQRHRWSEKKDIRKPSEMWGRVENRKELLCQHLRTEQLFKSGPATSPEYVWHSELKEVDDTELQFSGFFFCLDMRF